MTANMPHRDQLGSIARDWVVRLVSGEVDTATMDRFLAWRAESPAHAAAFDRARRLYADAGTYEVALRPQGGLPRQRTLVLACALAACLLLTLPVLPARPDYAVPDGPARLFTLADGSRLLLDGGSAVNVRTSADGRNITLLRGRAWFKVAHAPGAPFIVRAKGGSVTDLGTAFAVDATGAGVRVDVTQGAVRVAAGDEACMLRAGGDALWGDGHLVTGIGRPEALAWREGQIIIRDQRFSDAVHLLDAYIPGRVFVLGDIGNARVGGVFSSRSAENGLEALVRSQGGRIRRFGSLLIVMGK